MNSLFSRGPRQGRAPFCFHYLCNYFGALFKSVPPRACHMHAGTALSLVHVPFPGSQQIPLQGRSAPRSQAAGQPQAARLGFPLIADQLWGADTTCCSP